MKETKLQQSFQKFRLDEILEKSGDFDSEDRRIEYQPDLDIPLLCCFCDWAGAGSSAIRSARSLKTFWPWSGIQNLLALLSRFSCRKTLGDRSSFGIPWRKGQAPCAGENAHATPGCPLLLFSRTLGVSG
jgi:hypothetical protein